MKNLWIKVESWSEKLMDKYFLKFSIFWFKMVLWLKEIGFNALIKQAKYKEAEKIFIEVCKFVSITTTDIKPEIALLFTSVSLDTVLRMQQAVDFINGKYDKDTLIITH